MVVADATATRNHSSHKEEEEGSTNNRRGSNIQESQVVVKHPLQFSMFFVRFFADGAQFQPSFHLLILLTNCTMAAGSVWFIH